MVDDIRRWSDELAHDPSSLVFLQLGEALRRQGQLDVALKIALRGLERHPHDVAAHDLVARIAVDRRDFVRAVEEWEIVLRLQPEHLGAMKGLGYISFRQGRLDDAERFLARAADGGAGTAVTNALETVRRSSGGVAESWLTPDEIEPNDSDDPNEPNDSNDPSDPTHSNDPNDPQRLFADLLVDDGQTALLLDGNGFVLGGVYMDGDGMDVSQEIGAQLCGISEEVVRAMRHLDIGDWESITFETHAAVVAMAPETDGALVVVAASRATPLGLLRRLLDRCGERAASWIGGGGRES